MRFAYLRDPLFLGCFALYWINRLALEKLWPAGPHHAYLNDLLLVPFWIPPMLWAQRALRLRTHDGPPEPPEIAVPVVIWSVWFELLLPGRVTGAVGDPLDVVAYVAGGIIAWSAWKWNGARSASAMVLLHGCRSTISVPSEAAPVSSSVDQRT